MEKYEHLIYDKILKNKYLMITAPTGTGKSTYIPTLIHKRFSDYTVALIQPRRLAVQNIYSFLKSRIHHLSYKIRHAHRYHRDGKITIMTDGMFIKDIMGGKKYDIVIVDEVHERSMRIEFILMWLKSANVKKSIFMSATVDDDDIEQYFGCERLDLQIKGYGVSLIYEKEAVCDYIVAAYYKVKNILMNYDRANGLYDLTKTDKKQKNAMRDIHESNKKKIKQKNKEDDAVKDIHESNKKKTRQKNKKDDAAKDILVFLPGEEDILELKKMLKRLCVDAIAVYSNNNYHHIIKREYRSTSVEEQLDKPQTRVILATNIAETSITIPNVKYVIDTGVHKTKIFKNVNFLGIQRISKESSDQRKGRCNRTTDGICYRLYREEEYTKMTKMVPEILRCDLCDILLWMCAVQMDILRCKFLVYPSKTNVKKGLEFLLKIGAVLITCNDIQNEKRIDHTCQTKSAKKTEQKLLNGRIEQKTSTLTNCFVKITSYGIKLLGYPLDVKLSNFLQISNDLGCGKICAKIVSLINEENYNFLVSPKKSDILSLLDLMNAYLQENSEHDQNQYIKTKTKENIFNDTDDALIENNETHFDKIRFCVDNKINIKAMRRCSLTNNQLQKRASGTQIENIERAFYLSFNHNTAVLLTNGCYELSDGLHVYIHPSSYFFNKRLKKIVFVDVLCTSKPYARIVGRCL